jgi:hypothetical protein
VSSGIPADGAGAERNLNQGRARNTRRVRSVRRVVVVRGQTCSSVRGRRRGCASSLRPCFCRRLSEPPIRWARGVPL